MDSCAQSKINTRGQMVMKGRQEVVAATYDAKNAKKELANAIIRHEYPLSIVDHLGFRRFLAALQPSFQVPSRNAIKEEIFKIYDNEKPIAMKVLDSNEGRVAITLDMWTSSNKKRGYMAITSHYIDNTWKLQSRILRFIYIPTPITSDRLSTVLFYCLMDWNIDTKLSTITLDNCNTNNSLIDKIKYKLPVHKLWQEGSLLQMHCCAHIINLIAKDGLEVVKDVVEKIRDSIDYWTATTKKKEKFERSARQLHIPYSKKLSLDCPTRWDSTYEMLNVAIAYKDVFRRLTICDSEYTCFPTKEQWELAKDICGRLKLFNNFTKLISGSQYPTANIYFPEICEIKLAISQWLMSPIEVIQKMAKKMFDKFENYWSVVHDIMGVATVLDPRYKMELIEYYYEKLYEVDSLAQVDKIRQLCYNLFADYQLQMSKKNNSGSQSLKASNIVGDGALSDYDLYIARKKRARTSYVKTELELYLEEEVLPRTPNFDILVWWKLNGVKYPTLQAIAKDVLAIPISTVVSELTFSSSGHILSPHRSRLHWATLEALTCAKNWLWSVKNTSSSCPHSTATLDYTTLLDGMESDDEDELLASDVVHPLEEE